MNRQAAESSRTVARLRGMSDLTGESLRRRGELRGRLTSLLDSYGYRSLDTPLLEPTELFLRKSGGELASQLFSFTDPATRAVSLRPEFTAPAMRHYLENAAEIELPARWHYCGPVFRFDSAALQDGAVNDSQFTQIGGELLGASSVLADMELLDLAVAALEVSGVRGWTLRLADLDILDGLLEPLGLSERARAFVVQNVPFLSDGPSAISRIADDARRLHITGRNAEDDYLSQAVQGLDDEEARHVLLGVLRSNPLDQLGQRKPEEVVERLLRKIRRPDAEDSLRLALETACELAQVRGEPSTALPRAFAVLRKAGADTSAAGRLEQIMETILSNQGDSGRIELDLGLVRGLAYYNGIIFEVSHPSWPGALGGGGRYDGLARDLGGRHRLPALGFAYNLDALVELAVSAASGSAASPAGVLVVAANHAANAAALNAARKLRQQGELAEIEVSGLSEEAARASAARRGLSRVMMVG